MTPSNDFQLNNSNFFRVDGAINDASRPPVSVRCPHCRELGSFNVVREKAIAFQKSGKYRGVTTAKDFYSSIRICPNTKCKGLIFVVEDNQEVVEIEPPQLLDFDPENLPTRLERTLKEAVACHAAGAYRAAAMMVRRLLEEICEANSAGGNDLHNRLAALKNLVVLPQPFFEAMGELKALGNDAAHVEAKAYDTIGREEAEDSIELAKEILKALYQLKGLIGRLQARKNQPAS